MGSRPDTPPAGGGQGSSSASSGAGWSGGVPVDVVPVWIPSGSPGDCNQQKATNWLVECNPLPLPPEPTASADPVTGELPPPPDMGQLAREVVVRLRLPDPTPLIGPDPSVNEWGMAAVGYPLWLWTVGPDDVSATVVAFGYTFTLAAHRVSTTFVMGDGGSVTCTVTTPFSEGVTPGVASPSCGYVYRIPSRPGPDYLVSATTNWVVSWSALGQSGVIPATYAGSRTLSVGELYSLVTK